MKKSLTFANLILFVIIKAQTFPCSVSNVFANPLSTKPIINNRTENVFNVNSSPCNSCIQPIEIPKGASVYIELNGFNIYTDFNSTNDFVGMLLLDANGPTANIVKQNFVTHDNYYNYDQNPTLFWVNVPQAGTYFLYPARYYTPNNCYSDVLEGKVVIQQQAGCLPNDARPVHSVQNPYSVSDELNINNIPIGEVIEVNISVNSNITITATSNNCTPKITLLDANNRNAGIIKKSTLINGIETISMDIDAGTYYAYITENNTNNTWPNNCFIAQGNIHNANLFIESNGYGTSSIQDLKIENAELSPNPANENTLFTFSTNKSSELKVSLVDICGKILMSIPDNESTTNHHFNINTQNISNGIYILKVVNNAGDIYSQKIVITH